MDDDLYNELASTTTAPRVKIVEYLQKVAEETSELPSRELLERSGDSQFRDPKTHGEIIAAKLLHILLLQDIVEDESDLFELRDLAQQLTSETDRVALWAEFIEKAHALKDK